jgi:hypothetical protein
MLHIGTGGGGGRRADGLPPDMFTVPERIPASVRVSVPISLPSVAPSICAHTNFLPRRSGWIHQHLLNLRHYSELHTLYPTLTSTRPRQIVIPSGDGSDQVKRPQFDQLWFEFSSEGGSVWDHLIRTSRCSGLEGFFGTARLDKIYFPQVTLPGTPTACIL